MYSKIQADIYHSSYLNSYSLDSINKAIAAIKASKVKFDIVRNVTDFKGMIFNSMKHLGLDSDALSKLDCIKLKVKALNNLAYLKRSIL